MKITPILVEGLVGKFKVDADATEHTLAHPMTYERFKDHVVGNKAVELDDLTLFAFR